MRLSNTIFAFALAASTAAVPLRLRSSLSTAQIDALAPQLGATAGTDPLGNGNCGGAVKGSNGQPIAVPCTCPPDRTAFVAALQADIEAGHAVHNPTVPFSFPTDDSTASQITRVQAALVALQNLFGEGVGCPAASTTLSAQLSALQDGPQTAATTPAAAPPAAAAPPPPPPAAAPPASSGSLSTAQIDALAPQLGATAGTDPLGNGNCGGAVKGSNGQPIAVPCTCPPDRTAFIAALQADIEAGHAVNNPNVPFSFPTDNSLSSQITRVQSSLVALQNLFGEGVGCPAASTTLSAQLSSLLAQQ